MNKKWCVCLLLAVSIHLTACQTTLARPTSPPASASVPGWQTYTNAKYGFTLDYPPGWIYLEVPTSTYPTQNDGVWFDDSGFPPPGTDAQTDVVITLMDEDPTPNWQPEFFDNYASETIQINGISAVRISGTGKESLRAEVVVIAQLDNVYLQAQTDRTSDLTFFDQMVASLRTSR